MKAARKADMKAILSADTLLVDGKRYTMDTVGNLKLPQSSTNPQESKTSGLRSNGDTILFYGKSSVLSNFHNAPMNVDGKEFNCAEQYYQYHRCVTVGDTTAADKVLSSDDPVVQKRCGDRAKCDREDLTDAWESLKHEVMFKANLEKFKQNPTLNDYLQGTEPKRLAEANPHDTYWGTGVHISRLEAFDEWPGQNHMGTTLMSVRQHLLTQANTD